MGSLEKDAPELVAAWRKKVANVLAGLSVLFVVVAMPLALVSMVNLMVLASCVLLAYVFLAYPLSLPGRIGQFAGIMIDLVGVILSLGAAIYKVSIFQEVVYLRPGMVIPSDIVWMIILALVILEAVRRTSGNSLVILGMIFLVYNFAGPYLPSLISHRGYDLSRLTSQLFLTNQGFFGVPVQVIIQYVVVFVLFGSILEISGGSQFLIDVARSKTGHMTGGIGKVAMVASGLMGMISGSAVANVATVGGITIPAMRKSGYEPHVAGAIEAVASTGGQIMPPVMAAAAFLMADFLEISYLKVAQYALVPALLYYFSGMISVHFYALKKGLVGEPRESLPRLRNILRERGFLSIPIVLLIVLLIGGYSPTMAGLVGAISGIVVSWFSKDKSLRMTPMNIWRALVNSGRSMGSLIATSATAGIIVGVINLTGLGPKLSNVLVTLSGGHLMILLILTAITSIIMGMGMPTTVCYLVLATLVAPGLTQMGANVIMSHLFIFYFGILSMITPPVALAAYAAAAIAGSNASKVGWTAMLMVVSSFLIPFAFVYSPALALLGNPIDSVISIIATCVGIVFLAGGAIGHYFYGPVQLVQRALFIVAAILLITPGLITDFIGLAIGIVVTLWLKALKGKECPA